LLLDPSANFAFVKAPILAEMETGKTIASTPSRSLVDPGHRHLKQISDLLHAEKRAPGADAVRMTVLQVALSIEDLIDCMFYSALVGHGPKEVAKGRKGPLVRELDELLESGRLGFEAKLRLARILRIITKKQHSRLDRLKTLRNRCAHAWMLDVVHKRAKTPRPSKRLLEYAGRNLFNLKVLEEFVHEFGKIYLNLYKKYLS